MVQLRLGTRKSLLAMAQSQWVANQLTQKHPHLKVTLVGIDTQGDQILDRPLQQLEGKDFFVKELDHALLSGKVDFAVHSMKDLSLTRPPEIQLAAIPQREDPRDVLLFSPRLAKQRPEGSLKALRIGTSSPRRIHLLEPFLKKALPSSLQTAAIEFRSIRGNVISRLSRIFEAPESDRSCDAVVLAAAGLKRLAHDPEGAKALEPLLAQIRWMYLPLQSFPTAPAQGALAVECLRSRTDLVQDLSALHDHFTADQVQNERAVLQEWGGGCHQILGAYSRHIDGLGSLVRVLGIKDLEHDPVLRSELRWNKPALPKTPAMRFWNSREIEQKAHSFQVIPNPPATEDFQTVQKSQAIFVAHPNAMPQSWLETIQQQRLWAAGMQTWFALAKQNLWVEGCAEWEGQREVLNALPEKPLSHLDFPSADYWVIFTHGQAQSDPNMPTLATYTSGVYTADLPGAGSDFFEAFASASVLFWKSRSHFEKMELLLDQHPHKNKILHCCLPGKTGRYLQTKLPKNQLVFFPDEKEWEQWTNS